MTLAAVAVVLVLALVLSAYVRRMERAYAAARRDCARESDERIAEMAAAHSAVLTYPRDPLEGWRNA